MILNVSTPNGVSTKRRLWGVAFRPERRTIRTESPWVPSDDDSGKKTRLPSEQVDAAGLASWGEEWERVSKPFYTVRIRVLGQYRHVGSRDLPQQAALLWDSALFHLWGFAKHPKPRFNVLRPGDTNPPLLLPEVSLLRENLRLQCSQEGLDFDAFNFNFFQREKNKH